MNPHEDNNQSIARFSNPNGQTNGICNDNSKPHFFSRAGVRYYMETFTQIFIIAGGAGVAIAAMLAIFAHHRDWVIWMTWFGVVCLITSGFCWFQDKEWKRDATVVPNGGNSLIRPNVIFLDTKLVLPEKPNEPVIVKFTLVNNGESDAVVTIWDKTLIYNLTGETKFSYQSNEPLTFSVTAMKGVGNHAEMCFYGAFTPEMWMFLKAGKARLFVFARGTYRNGDGTIYPLPFARMYHPELPGNLIFCPDSIVVE